jgi:biotin synthase-like enzyme
VLLKSEKYRYTTGRKKGERKRKIREKNDVIKQAENMKQEGNKTKTVTTKGRKISK